MMIMRKSPCGLGRSSLGSSGVYAICPRILALGGSDCLWLPLAPRHSFSIFTPILGFFLYQHFSSTFCLLYLIVDCIIHLAGVLGLSPALSLSSYGLDDERQLTALPATLLETMTTRGKQRKNKKKENKISFLRE